MKKNLLPFLLITLMSLAGKSAFAHDIEALNSDGITIYYNWINNNTELAVSYQGSNSSTYSNEYRGNVVIPESVNYNGNTYNVTSISTSAFSGCSEITFVTIPKTVTSIGNDAFRGCSKLKSITIPSSVTIIGSDAFSGCNGLTRVTISNGVITIGNSAFYGCSSLTSVEIPKSVTSIGDYAFYRCSGVTRVTITNSVTSIGDHTFYGCCALTSVKIPGSVTSIGSSAFYNCSLLASVEIPNSVTSIGNTAFYGCSLLTSVEIPNSVTSIGSSAFSGCSGLTSITIPNSVTSIGTKAFYNCNNITDVYVDIKEPLTISSTTFSNSYKAILHVPNDCVDTYMAADYWKEFKDIEEVTFQCPTPSISVQDGKISFSCSWEGVDFHYNISSQTSGIGKSAIIPESTTYTVSVYASKDGYTDSNLSSKTITIQNGDMNYDGKVTVTDALMIVDQILKNK